MVEGTELPRKPVGSWTFANARPLGAVVHGPLSRDRIS